MTNHLWQSTVFALAAGVLTLAFRKNRAQVRYWLWFVALVKFLIPFALLMSLGSQTPRPAIVEKIAPAAVTVRMVGFAEPLPETLLPVAPRSRVPWPPIVWACGFAGVVLMRLRGWSRVRAAVRASMPAHLPAPVEIRSAPGLLEPGVVGVLRPVLLLPEGIEEKLTSTQLDAVLAHELCHVRRRDNLTSAIHMLVEAFFWFHPVVWWIGGRLVEERERACDEEVLRLGGDPRDYAGAILNVCKLYVESPLACVAGVTGADLKKRIEAIMSNRILFNLTAGRKAALAAACLTAIALPVAVGILRAQSAANATTPRFEVASIKPCQRGVTREGDSSPGSLRSGCAFLADDDSTGHIQRAYVRFAGGHSNPVRVLQIEGGPKWIHSEEFEIDAKAEGHPSLEMMEGPMMQALLEDRFKLKIHRETRQGPVYELTLAKGASKLKPFQEGSCVLLPSGPPFTPLQPGQAYCQVVVSPGGSIDVEGSGLMDLSGLLSLILDRPVIDKTGVAGKFDIHLRFSRDGLAAEQNGTTPDERVAAVDPGGPTVFTALQEQLGLKLVPAKGPIDVLVIDHVERPGEN